MEKKDVLILGDGRISQAVLHYLKKRRISADLFSQIKTKKNIKKISLLISALPSEEAELGLELALKYKKHLIDISDLDPPFYLKRRKEIEKQNIFVVPGCGFCPGLINFIIGRELSLDPQINQVFIKAGSFSRKNNFFPFLWCFKDLITEHKLSSWQIVKGKKKKCLPFSGYREESFLDIPLESYLSVSGFENILSKRKFLDFQFRVVRPRGFRIFFNFLDNYGFFKKENLNLSAQILERIKEDNFTFGQIELVNPKRKIVWKFWSFSSGRERLNSMQKITSLVPVNLVEFFLRKKPYLSGLIFMEDLAENKEIFDFLINKLVNYLSLKRSLLKKGR